MIGVPVVCLLYILQTRPGGEKEDKEINFSPVLKPLLFMVDISHMHMPTPASQSMCLCEVSDICIIMHVYVSHATF